MLSSPGMLIQRLLHALMAARRPLLQLTNRYVLTDEGCIARD